MHNDLTPREQYEKLSKPQKEALVVIYHNELALSIKKNTTKALERKGLIEVIGERLSRLSEKGKVMMDEVKYEIVKKKEERVGRREKKNDEEVEEEIKIGSVRIWNPGKH